MRHIHRLRSPGRGGSVQVVPGVPAGPSVSQAELGRLSVCRHYTRMRIKCCSWTCIHVAKRCFGSRRWVSTSPMGTLKAFRPTLARGGPASKSCWRWPKSLAQAGSHGATREQRKRAASEQRQKRIAAEEERIAAQMQRDLAPVCTPAGLTPGTDTHSHCIMSLYRQECEGQQSMDGLRAAALYQWPGPVHLGNGKMQLIIDERADARQRTALVKIMSGEETMRWRRCGGYIPRCAQQSCRCCFAPIRLEIDVDARKCQLVGPGSSRHRISRSGTR
jgi:hypothetical protein